MKKYCKIVKEWGGFAVGTELWIGEPKAGHLQAQGKVAFIPTPKIKKPKVETATIKPEKETAELTPTVETKKNVKTKKKVQAKKGG